MKLSNVRIGDRISFTYIKPGASFDTRGYVVEKTSSIIALAQSREEHGIEVEYETKWIRNLKKTGKIN